MKHDRKNIPREEEDKISKGRRYDSYAYLLDSTNLVHYNSNESMCHEIVLDRVRDQIKMGLRSPDTKLTADVIQNLYD